MFVSIVVDVFIVGAVVVVVGVEAVEGVGVVVVVEDEDSGVIPGEELLVLTESSGLVDIFQNLKIRKKNHYNVLKKKLYFYDSSNINIIEVYSFNKKSKFKVSYQFKNPLRVAHRAVERLHMLFTWRGYLQYPRRSVFERGGYVVLHN